MSSERIEELLQECLAAYDAGLSPEECLSAFPAQRHILEPLLRQALSLRYAYAAAPNEQFVSEAREKLLFAAGRDVSHAFAAQPDERFVNQARYRLVRAAGAPAQEALRAVPPPRLPFWLNARRRLLEAATLSRPRPATHPMAMGLRTGLSAAVVVLALFVAGVAYLTQTTHPTSVSAQLAEVELQLQQVEQQTAAGQPVDTGTLVELTRKTNDLANKLSDQPSSPVSDKLPDIIDRQRDVVNQVAASDATAAASPALQQAQQHLNQAEDTVRLLAARVDQPTTTPSSSGQAVAPSPTSTPLPTATTPAPTTTTVKPSGTVTPLPAGQVRIGLALGDTTYALTWQKIETAKLSFVVPIDWKVIGIAVSSSGQAVLESPFLRVDGGGAILVINTQTGEIAAVIDNEQLTLRDEGPDGKQIDVNSLAEAAGTLAPLLHHMLDSLDVTGSLVPPTPTRTATPKPSPTATSTPAATPSPSPTP